MIEEISLLRLCSLLINLVTHLNKLIVCYQFTISLLLSYSQYRLFILFIKILQLLQLLALHYVMSLGKGGQGKGATRQGEGQGSRSREVRKG